MILLAVGTQLPFDRLVRTVDNWAAASRTVEVVAQVGASSYKPTSLRAQAFLPPAEFESLLQRATLVIAHCGMGSILSALSHGKPIIVMPRSAAKGEHRNDHQLATAQRFSGQAGVTVAWDEDELRSCLEHLDIAACARPGLALIARKAPRELTDRLRAFLYGDE